MGSLFSGGFFSVPSFAVPLSPVANPEKRDILPLLAVWSLAYGGNSLIQCILLGSSRWEEFLVAVLGLVVGLGLVFRDRSFGLFGALVWVFFQFVEVWNTRWAPSVSGSDRYAHMALGMVLPVGVYVALRLVRSHGFIRRSLEGLVGGASGRGALGQTTLVGKTCDACGKAVGLGAKIGDTCPHCGVRWGAAKQTLVGSNRPWQG